MTNHYDNYESTIDNLLQTVGHHIVIGIPLGIGKPIGFLNALYKRAKTDNNIQLTIFTGLTLSRPTDYHNELEKRFIAPISDRIFQNYENPLFEEDRLLQIVPDNIKIIEFFLTPGKYLENRYVQENYISSAYTSVVDDLSHYAINVIAQPVATSPAMPNKLSLSSNTDLFHATVNLIKSRTNHFAVVAEVNQHLPFMLNDAVVADDTFTHIIDTHSYRTLFSIPREELSTKDHMIGLYTSCLIRDNGCLQIGIGKLGTAVSNALIMRHKFNADYIKLLSELQVEKKFAKELSSIGETTPFSKGIYASTEMFSGDYLQLYYENILKKRVYDHIALQRLLNENLLDEKITVKTLDILIQHHVIHPICTESDAEFLKKFGILKATILFKENNFITAKGDAIPADFISTESRSRIAQECLGDHLLTGKIVHAGFFMGNQDFYAELRNLSDAERSLIDMTSVARTNSLSQAPELFALQRMHARFVNSALMVTVNGAIISDGLMNNIELSGVGGQFDFMYMARHLPHARAIINLHSVRQVKRRIYSNILWEYSNQTIPRYLRDIVVTEYGIADCRSKTDAEIIKAILNITDSRFQQALLQQAKSNKKIPLDYEIPAIFREQNNPDFIQSIIKNYQAKGYCQPYPFGSDLTAEEQIIKSALSKLKTMSWMKFMWTILAALCIHRNQQPIEQYLIRMQLLHPKSLKEYFYKKLLMKIL